jgi:hypothetical protein
MLILHHRSLATQLGKRTGLISSGVLNDFRCEHNVRKVAHERKHSCLEGQMKTTLSGGGEQWSEHISFSQTLNFR